MENGISSLDPLGPEFGKIQGPAINSRSLSPFEGEKSREIKDYFPVSPPLVTTNPHYPIQDAITGRSPNLPSSKNPNKKLSANEIANAIGEEFKMKVALNHDKNEYAKVNAYNAGPSGNSFYKRYAAFGQEKFDEIGFSPMRDNEAIYNASTTWGDRATRMMKNSFLPLLSRGFVSGPKSLVKLMQGDFSVDREDARIYEEAAAIGQDSSKGFGAFFSNTAMSFAYTAGIISEAILEEAAGALLAPLTGGGSFFVATANNARKLNRLGDATELATKGYNAVNRTINEANTITGARNMWKAAGSINSTKVGRFLNPLENTFDAFTGIGKNADNLTGFARLSQSTSRTAGGLFKDVRNINMALSEARLEGGMNDNKVYDDLYDAFYKKNGRGPNDNEQYTLTKKAKESGMNTLMWNTALIFATNKVVFPNLMKSGVGKRIINSKIDDVLTMKGGKIILEKTAQAGKKVVKGEFKYVADSFKNSLKGFKGAPIKTTAKIAGKYLKGNLMEGVQENLQDVITVANEKYYETAYKNKELGAHLYNKAQSSLMFDGLKDQFSAQGFETFASGALMGVFSGGLNLVKGGLDAGYNHIFNKEEFTKYKDLRKTHGETVAKRLTEMYNDPKEFFNSRLFNYGVQNNTVSNVDEADIKDAKDELSQAFVTQITTALDNNTINYFKDHLSSFKGLSIEEFEEAFGFEKGTGAKKQDKIDTILGNIDTVEKTYKYANDRFPNPVNLDNYKTDSPEYEDAALLYQAWENGKRNYVFSNHAFMNVTGRMKSITGDILNNPSMKNMSQLDMDMIFQPVKIASEISMLNNEIESLKSSTDPATKKQVLDKQNKVKALENFSEAHSKHTVYNDRHTHSENLFNEYMKKTGQTELSDDEKEYILNTAFGEKTDQNDIMMDAELEDAYKKFLKTANGIDQSYIFDTDIDKSFGELLNFYTLNSESKKLVTHINLLHNPDSYIEYVQKTKLWMTSMYENRKEYFTDMVNAQINGLENNELLNTLANMNIYMDLDAFHDYMTNDVLPAEFFDETTKQVIPKGTARYNEIYNILALNKHVKSQEVDKPTLDEKLQNEVDKLDNFEAKEIDDLPKVETIKIIKHVTASTEKVTIKDILEDIDKGQYVDAVYDKDNQKVTMYFAFDGLKMDNKDGKIIDTDNVKDKFSEYTIYKKSLEADPELVKGIKEKYDALKDETAEKFNEQKAKTKADIYSNYTPTEQLPKDLNKQLKVAFSESEEGIYADEIEAGDDELSDLFKAFVKNNSVAADIITEYNNNSKAEVEKESLGVIEDFDFTLDNKKLNTANYSIEDIKIFKKQFEDLRDSADKVLEKTSYATTINKFDKLIYTRDIQKFTPEVQEIIKKLTEGLIAKQSQISKLGEEGYVVSNNILGRVSNFIEPFKTNKYRYAGAGEVEKAFDITIGAVGLSETSIPSFITQLKTRLHVDSVKKNYGYTDGTESILKEHLTNLLKKGISKEDLLNDIQAVVSENTYEASRDGGTYVDDQLRDFFTKGKAPVFNEKKITREAYDSLFGPKSFLKDIKQKIDSGELYTIAKGLKVYDVESNVAGEMDLLLIDKQGKLQIIDFKTGKEDKWDGFVDKTESGLNKTEAYTLQQYTYARLLKKMTGLDAEINIFPIEVTLDQNNKIVTSADAPTNSKLTGIGNWYFSLDPTFANVKEKIDNAIGIETPVIKAATSINPVYKKQLSNMQYPNDVINTFTKEDASKLIDDKVPYIEYVKQNSVLSMTFGETPTTDTKADIEKRRQEALKISEINFEPLTTTVDGSWDKAKPINNELENRFKNSLKEGDKIITGNNETIFFRNGKIVKKDGKDYGMSDIPTTAILIKGAKIDRTDKINAKYDAELAKELYKEIKAGKLVTDMTVAEQAVANKYITEELRKSVDAELAALKTPTETITPVTKASELNLQKGDTLIVKQPIPGLINVVGSTVTVLKSDDKSVSFTYDNEEKTLTLPEVNKHLTTMDIEETIKAETTTEILDAIDKDIIEQSISAFDIFMNDDNAIPDAIKEANKEEMSKIEDDLLNDLKCK